MNCTVCATPNAPDAAHCVGCGGGLAEALRPVRLVPCQEGIEADLPLVRSPLIVGRASSGGPVDLDLAASGPAEAVSRRHALLFYDHGSWKVQDLGSANGTFVRKRGAGEFVPCQPAPVAVEAGDEIAFGDRLFAVWDA